MSVLSCSYLDFYWQHDAMGFFVCLFQVVFFLSFPHLLCSDLTLGSTLRDHSWWFLGIHMWSPRSSARQVSHLIYYHSSLVCQLCHNFFHLLPSIFSAHFSYLFKTLYWNCLQSLLFSYHLM